MTSNLYQAKFGDGLKKKGMNRKDSFFNTPTEAISEAFALKERMDKKYDNQIIWDYNGKITGSSKKMKILKGILKGNKDAKTFYLQIVAVGNHTNEMNATTPNQPKKFTAADNKIVKKAVSLLK